jgi:hypothetical protein
VADELKRSEVLARPRPTEYNQDGVARDPRRGQYKEYGSPYSRLCKEVKQGGQGSKEIRRTV